MLIRIKLQSGEEIQKEWITNNEEPVEIDLDKLVSCERKLKHKNEAAATKAAVSFSEKKGRIFEAYKCRHCEAWHVGKQAIIPTGTPSLWMHI